MMSNLYDLSNKLSARRAVILARVSSREQEDGYSIDAQTHRLESYCQRKDLNIIKSFAITESSTQGDRRKFMEVIKFIRSQKEIIALVADKVDRVQRSFKEHPLLDALINEGKIELHFNTENYIIHKNSVSQERLMWSMGVIMAQSYIDSMRDNVRRSIEQKVRQGEYISQAPIGYLNVKKPNGKSWISIDPDRGLLVRRLFQEYSTGSYTIPELLKECTEWGLRNKSGNQSFLNKSHLHRILTNPFYFGQMEVKGKPYPHVYEPLITQELFEQCQDVLKSWNKKPFKYAGKEFVFRGLIKCATSGKVVTADTKTKTYKNGKTASWTYLRCANPDQPDKKMFIREEKILEQVKGIIDELHLPEELFEAVKTYIQNTAYIEREYRNRHFNELHKRHVALIAKIDRIMDLLAEKVISEEDYARKRLNLENELRDVNVQIKAHRAGNDGFNDAFINLLNIASKSSELFKGSTIPQKRRLVNFVFANLEMKGGKLLYSLNTPFDLFPQKRSLEEWRELVDCLRTNELLRKAVIALSQNPHLENFEDNAS